MGNPIYTQTDANKLDDDAYAHFLAVAGLDFSQAVIDPLTGLLTISDANGKLAILLPLSIGNDGNYNVLYDSKMARKNSGKWTIRNNSLIVQYERSGVIASGTAAGQSFAKGDILSYGYTDHLRLNSNWNNPIFREQFIVYTQRPGKQPVGSFNQPEVHASLQYVSPMDEIGYGSDNVYREVENSSTRQVTHHVITFFEADNLSGK